jgi:hypothetical protein
LVDPPQGEECPLITFVGFIDVATIDVLESPSPNLLYRPGLNAMLQHFNLFSERGPIPETGGILPDYPSANVLERLKKFREAWEEEQSETQVEIQSTTKRPSRWGRVVSAAEGLNKVANGINNTLTVFEALGNI